MCPTNPPKCAQTQKNKNKNRISSPIFASDPQFSNFDPMFSNFMKIRKEGTKSEQWTCWVLDWEDFKKEEGKRLGGKRFMTMWVDVNFIVTFHLYFSSTNVGRHSVVYEETARNPKNATTYASSFCSCAVVSSLNPKTRASKYALSLRGLFLCMCARAFWSVSVHFFCLR
jgi:hypothetical protein